MAKSPIKELEKTTHKLQIEANINITDDGFILVETEDGEALKLSILMNKFNGKFAKIVVAEDFEKELDLSEEDEE